VTLNLRLARPEQTVDDGWRRLPVQPRGDCRLGISFRPRQAEAFGLDGHSTLDQLLANPFDVIRLAAYWDRIEPQDGGFDTTELDWQLRPPSEPASRSSGVGAVKTSATPRAGAEAPPCAAAEGSLVTPNRTPSCGGGGDHLRGVAGIRPAIDHRVAARARGRRPARCRALMAAQRGASRASSRVSKKLIPKGP
jgi:hypothetical protein